jgi:hypothetical protein
VRIPSGATHYIGGHFYRVRRRSRAGAGAVWEAWEVSVENGHHDLYLNEWVNGDWVSVSDREAAILGEVEVAW